MRVLLKWVLTPKIAKKSEKLSKSKLDSKSESKLLKIFENPLNILKKSLKAQKIAFEDPLSPPLKSFEKNELVQNLMSKYTKPAGKLHFFNKSCICARVLED